MPSCGDESNAIGSCFYGYKKYCEENKILFNPQPLKNLYLGPEYGN
jgi:predicted NodU family carbamoyl transferase